MSSDIVAVGIDLGTTNSCIGVLRNGRVEIIAGEQGNRLTPSVVAFTDEIVLVGDAAKTQACFNPENTIYEAKRVMGRKYGEHDVQKKLKQWPFKLIGDEESGRPNYQIKYRGNHKLITPEEISAMVLENMRKTAEDFIGNSVTRAVITVPAYFNDAQRQATIDAAAIAGLKVLAIINEPTAAAIAYGFDKKVKKHRNILIFDLGGGTFDVVILNIENGKFVAKAVSGDSNLGGSDFDNRLMDFLKKDFFKKTKLDVTGDPKAMSKLRKQAELTKKDLSVNLKERVQIESLFEGIDYETTVTRSRFEDLCSDLFGNTLAPVHTVLTDMGIGKDDIDEVVLVGGSTRMLKIQEILADFFKGKTLNKTINPDEAVAYGAAVYADYLCNETSMNEYNISDITPLSLGITKQGDEMSVIIPRNTKIPTQQTKKFTTNSNYQSCIDFEVLEGNSKMSRDNHVLKEFALDNIESNLKGVPKIHVTFEINKNGILHVTALDKSSGIEKKVDIKGNSRGLSEEEIERMKVEHSKYLHDIEMALELDRIRVNLDEFCNKTCSDIEKMRDKSKLSADKYDKINKACQRVLSWLDDNPDASISNIEKQEKQLKKLCKQLQ